MVLLAWKKDMMSNHVNRCYAAVSVPAGHGHIKQRLVKAYEENLAVIENEDLPLAVKQSFADLRHLMSRNELVHRLVSSESECRMSH